MSSLWRWSRSLLERLHLTRRTRIDPSDIEAELTTLVANTSVGIGIVNATGHFVRTNAALERFLGYGVGELVGVSVRDVSHPDYFELDLIHYRKLQSGDGTAYQYLVLFEIETDDPMAALAKMGAAVESGDIQMSDTLGAPIWTSMYQAIPGANLAA